MQNYQNLFYLEILLNRWIRSEKSTLPETKAMNKLFLFGNFVQSFNCWARSEKSTLPEIKARNKILFLQCIVQRGVAPTELDSYYSSHLQRYRPAGAFRAKHPGCGLYVVSPVGATPL